MDFEPLKKSKLPEGIDSLQEVYFEWWLSELVHLGFVEKFERCKRYELIENVMHDALDFKPIKINPIRQLIIQKSFLQNWTYEPDYNVYWTEKSLNFLFQDIDFLYPKTFSSFFYAKLVKGKWFSVIDIKPQVFRGGAMSSSVKFPIIQKMMYYKFNTYVNKISPIGKKSLFDLTFTPERYLFQDARMKNRKISKWKPISIIEFIENEKFS